MRERIRTRKFNIAVLLAALLALTLAAPLAAYAATDTAPVVNGAYEVVEYNLRATVDKTHSYNVVENITVNFPDAVQSVSFAVPNGNFRLDGLAVKNAEYLETVKGDERFITINDAEQLTKGQHTYEIDYTLREFADRDELKDVFYFNLLMPSWMQPITKVNISVQFPLDFPWDDIQYFAGQFGVQNVDTKLDYVADEQSKTVTITGDRIPENFGITLQSDLPNNYWEGALDGAWATRFALILAAAVAVVLLILWLIGGRDPKFTKVKQVHPIEGITPVEMGYIFIGRVRIKDVIALIVHLGIKGYLKISEYAPKKYNLIRLSYPEGEEKYIRSAYDILFEDVPQDRGIDMEQVLPRLRQIKKSIGDDVAAGFSSPEMLAYTPLSKIFRTVGTVLVALLAGMSDLLRYSYAYQTPNYFEAIAVALLAGFLLTLLCRQFDRYYYAEQRDFTIRLILLSVAFALIPIYLAVQTILLTGQGFTAILCAALMLLSAFMVIIMRARAKGNASLSNRFMQLRHHIYHPAAKDIAENAFRDINYYYEIMPYALLFSGLETWAISFLSLPVPAPDWYSDDIEGNAISNLRTETETVVDYARDIKAFVRTIDDAYHARNKRHKN